MDMTRAELLASLRLHRPAIEAEGAVSLFIYGSRARDDHRADSDVDIFVDYDQAKAFNLFDLAGIKLLVDKALGLDAHVTTRDSLHPALKSGIEAQAIKVF
jgi:uncharacterized protein